MTNKELIKLYVTGSKQAGAVNHIGFTKNDFYNYSTLLCKVDRNNKTANFNSRKYSSTTSRIQGMLKTELLNNEYTVLEYNGPDAYI